MATEPTGLPRWSRPDRLTDGVGYGSVWAVGKVLVVLLAAVVIAESFLVIGVAAALFWLGSTGPIVIGGSMLVVSLVAGVLALRAMRPR